MKLLMILSFLMLSFISCTKPSADAQTGKVYDIDGNKYLTQVIGDQTWFMDDLITTRYNDDVAIEPAYTGQYTFAEVVTTKLCPLGWHVPAQWEWHVLIDYLNNSTSIDADVVSFGVGYWWSSSTLVEGYCSPEAWGFYSNTEGVVPRPFVINKDQYLSVRCIKNTHHDK